MSEIGPKIVRSLVPIFDRIDSRISRRIDNHCSEIRPPPKIFSRIQRNSSKYSTPLLSGGQQGQIADKVLVVNQNLLFYKQLCRYLIH